MTWHKKIIIFIILLFFLSSAANAQEQQVYQYKAKVFLVELQVSVFDKDGKFVEGLKPEDFIILDKGTAQKISHFDYVIHNQQNVELITPERPAHRRQFILLFDLSFSSRNGLVNARRAGNAFINMILPTDWVAVITFSSFQGLKVQADFTNDKSKLRKAINSLDLKKAEQLADSFIGDLEGLIGGGGITMENPLKKRIEGLEDLYALMKRTNALTLEALTGNFIKQFNTFAESLQAIEGKKNIIYLSEGFNSKALISKPRQDNIASLNLLTMEKMLERFVGSNCVIQSIDVDDLRPAYTGVSWNHPGHQILFYMAYDTGGIFYYNTNLLDRSLKNILELTSRYYAIGYYPKEIENEDKYRKIKVKVKRPGLKVVARKGYFEDKPYEEYTPLEKKVRIAKLISEDTMQNDIDFDTLISVFPGNREVARVPIFLQLPKQYILDKSGKDQTKLEMLGFLINDKGYFKDFIYTGITVDAKESKQWLESSHGIKHYDMLLAPPGSIR